DDGLRMKASVERGAQQERAVSENLQLGDLLTHMELRVEGPGLLQESIDEFLSTAHWQRWNVVNRLLGIELTALATRMFERVDDVRRNAEQSQLENLKQPAGTCADDDYVGLNGAFDGAFRLIAQQSTLWKILREAWFRAGPAFYTTRPLAFEIGLRAGDKDDEVQGTTVAAYVVRWMIKSHARFALRQESASTL
ncbi:MAG TPA: hypothetical protein VNA21_03095, partial [Steroidobacteraceae bacterium]|nr:hypothetical protein [Steroidobacteraceae bacterium]